MESYEGSRDRSLEFASFCRILRRFAEFCVVLPNFASFYYKAVQSPKIKSI